MEPNQERILVVGHDSLGNDLVARQTLEPLGYQVWVVPDVASAIQETARLSPDLIITPLVIPGLSGKDLLAALASQEAEIATIVIASKEQGEDLIQAFRLGAADWIWEPVRETELAAAVERVLKQSRLKRERTSLADRLSKTNQELQQRVRELTTIYAIGKAVTSITDQRNLLTRIVEGAVQVARADSGWLLLRQDTGKAYILKATINIPPELAEKLNQPWEDGVSSLVGLSAEPLAIHGEALKRFKMLRPWQSVLVAPIKAKRQVMGLLSVARRSGKPFHASSQTLVQAVADYASIALINMRLFQEIEQRAQALERAIQDADAAVNRAQQRMTTLIEPAQALVNEALTSLSELVEDSARMKPSQRTSLLAAQNHLIQLQRTLQETEAAALLPEKLI